MSEECAASINDPVTHSSRFERIEISLSRRETVALRIFAAMMSREIATVDLWPNLGEKQIKTAFALADVFLKVSENEPLWPYSAGDPASSSAVE